MRSLNREVIDGSSVAAVWVAAFGEEFAEGWDAQHLAAGFDGLPQAFNPMGDEQQTRLAALLLAQALVVERRDDGLAGEALNIGVARFAQPQCELADAFVKQQIVKGRPRRFERPTPAFGYLSY